MRVNKRRGSGGGGNGVPVRNGLVAEYRFDECRNLLKYSQQFDNVWWTKNRSTVSANAAAAPDGTTTADLVLDNAENGEHRVAQNIANIVLPFGASCYCKAGGWSRCQVQLNTAAATYPLVTFDLSSGTVTATTLGAVGYIQSVGDGWYRCSAYTANAEGANVLGTAIKLVDDSGNTAFLGDGTKGIYLWGAQLEVGSAATTYVPTTNKQTLMDYSKPRRNLLLPNQANACEDNVATWFTKVTAGDAVTASTTVAWQGTYSAKAVCANAAASEGLKTTDIIYGLKPSTTYTASAYVYGSAAAETVKIGIEETTDAGTSVGLTYANLTLGASWQRVTVSRTFGATGRGAKLYVITQSQQAATFYVDGLQLEEGSTATAWEAPPNIGILGSAVGADTNDPTWAGEGFSITTDDTCVLPDTLRGVSAFTIMHVCRTTTKVVHAGILVKNNCFAQLDSSTGGVDADEIYISITDGGTAQHIHLPLRLTSSWEVLTTKFKGSTILGARHNLGSWTTASAGLPATTLATYSPLRITPYGTYYRTGGDAYIIIYNRDLTDAEIAKNYAYLKSYLKKNRGIALP